MKALGPSPGTVKTSRTIVSSSTIEFNFRSQEALQDLATVRPGASLYRHLQLSAVFRANLGVPNTGGVADTQSEVLFIIYLCLNIHCVMNIY